MIPVPVGVKVWLSTGHTDMRKGFPGLSLMVQETLKRDPMCGHLFVFRGRGGGLIKVIWHDGQKACLFTKKLAEAATAKAEAASAKALVSHSEALIARLKLEIEKVRRELYGSRSERKARLLEQMELQLEELEANAGEDELAAEMAAKASVVRAFERKRRHASPFLNTCRASGSSSPPRRAALAAVPPSCRSWGKTSPRHSR
ncbi:transposase [Rhizobium azooxidifex]|uniref:Transposase n=1 Tax=Mycoplana azooxidifex TaxID=1636188 RepID=A0A7W6DAW7_9HYPH|nr:transposase [Mycoplana azooxidifex]